jgi:hypothetical protein
LGKRTEREKSFRHRKQAVVLSIHSTVPKGEEGEEGEEEGTLYQTDDVRHGKPDEVEG